MLYYTIKHVHVFCVVLSGLGFAVRGVGMMCGAGWLRWRWVRIAPHLVDTMLLSSALLLSWMIAQYPFVASWVTAKVFGLLVYIVLGGVALKRGRTRRVRVAAFVVALGVYVWIVSVAITRQPFGMLAMGGV